MGLLKGNMSYRAFRMEGDPIEDDPDALVSQIVRFRFRELMSDAELSIGWVQLDNMLATEFPKESTFHQQYVAVSLRIDRKAINGALFQAQLALELDQYKRDAKTEKVPAQERKEIRDRLRRKMMSEAEPSRRVFDMCWDVPRNLVYLFGGGDNVVDTFRDYFSRTFGRLIKPITLEGRIRVNLPPDQAETILTLAGPTHLATGA